MVRVKKSVSSRRRRKSLLSKAKGFSGDRKNHVRLSSDAVMKAMAFSTMHRRKRKGEFRSLWISRISTAAKSQGISYSKLIHGLSLINCGIDRKMLSEMAINDQNSFIAIVQRTKEALTTAHSNA